MARRPEGQVLERLWKSGRGYALRFRAYGERQYLTLGPETEGWDRRRAEEELANVMADVRRGIWTPPTRRARRTGAAEASDAMPTFDSFARSLMAARQSEMSEANYAYKENALAHILPYFGDWLLHEIDIQAVDAFRGHMVEVSEARRRARDSGQPMRNEGGQALRPLSPATINKTIDTLQWVLSVAVEYRYIAENPAAGRRRRLRAKRPAPVHLDSVEQIATLLEAAGQRDRDKRWLTNDRRPIIATLLFAGPRAGELCNLRWRDVDLANGRIRIAAPRLRPGCGRSSCSPSCATNSQPTRRAPTAVAPTIRCSPPGPAGTATRTTYATASSPRPSGEPTSCSKSAARRPCRMASLPTSCATPSPRS